MYSRFVGRIETSVYCYESISGKDVLSLFKKTINLTGITGCDQKIQKSSRLKLE